MILVRLLVAVLAGFAALFGLFLRLLLGLVGFALAATAAVFLLGALIAFLFYLETHDPALLRGTFKMLGMGAAPFALMLVLMFATEEAKDAWRRFLDRRRKARLTDAPFRE